MANRLAIPAVRQILAKLAKGEKEEEELVEKLEDSCLRYDHDKKGVRVNKKLCLHIYKVHFVLRCCLQMNTSMS